IHSQVGHHLAAARVNGRLVPLRYALKSGDTVEVVTSERQNPGKDWMNFAVTARAKSRIRQWLRSQQAERSQKWGITLLDRELEVLGLTVAQLRSARRFEPALREFSYKDIDSLLAAVGYGIITTAQLLAKVLSADELKLYRADKQAPPAPAGDAARTARDGRRPA